MHVSALLAVALVASDPAGPAAVPAVPEASQAAPESEADAYRAELARVLDDLVGQVTTLALQRNEILAGAKHYNRERRAGRWSELRVPNSALLVEYGRDGKPRLPETPAAFDASINKIRAHYAKLSRCAANAPGLPLSSIECAEFLKPCGFAFGAKNGALFRRAFTADGDVVESPAPPREPISFPDVDVIDLICRIAGLAGIDFKPAGAEVDDLRSAMSSVIPLPFAAGIATCTPAVKALPWKLMGSKSVVTSATWDDLHKQARTNFDRCRAAIGEFCAAVYPVAKTYALAYPTVGCEVRRVTRNDVTEDVERNKYAWTEAERLEHLEFVEVIDACAKAGNDGWAWIHKPPKVRADCKKPNAPRRNR